MLFIYNILISLAYYFVKFAKIFIPKLNDRENGAARTFKFFIEDWRNYKKIWFHASSMGEFEQAKPIIELIKQQHPEYKIICSFYSPSGYNNQKGYSYADAIFYMPFDKKSKARRFIDVIQPDVAVFVRYDIWLNHLDYAKSKGIPLYLINATAANSASNFISKAFYRKAYSYFNEIYAVSQDHYNKFLNLNIDTKLFLSADTRFDRIIERVDFAKENKVIPQDLFNDENILVAGSIWEKDFELVSAAVDKFNQLSDDKITCIYVPHEPTEEFISQIESKLDSTIRLSELIDMLANGDISKLQSGASIIVDSIGKLLMLYGNGRFAYIGGAFGVGVHSLTEPAGFGLPVFCGPNCFNAPDAKKMIEAGALKIVNDSGEFLSKITSLVGSENEYANQSQAASGYVRSAAGESKRIAELILEKLK